MSAFEANSDPSAPAPVVNICATAGCDKEAKLACPTCIKLGAPPTRFCGQECFKSSWDDHKQVHAQIRAAREAAIAADPSSMPREFKNYRFSGPLRPWKVTEKSIVPEGIALPDYSNHPEGRSASEELDKRNRDVIRVYNPTQIEGIRKACAIGREVLDAAGKAVRVGITADELDKIVHDETIKRGAYPSPLNYYNFPKSVCTSVNEIICHGMYRMRTH